MSCLLSNISTVDIVAAAIVVLTSRCCQQERFVTLRVSVCTKRVVFPHWPRPSFTLPLVVTTSHPSTKFYVTTHLSSALHLSPQHPLSDWLDPTLPLCPTEEHSTPTWSPWPGSSWRRAGRRKAPGSWPRCWTPCARPWRPSPALCGKQGSPTCE